MDKMKNSITLDGLKLNKGDKILIHESKWPIFRLNVLSKTGLWAKIKKKMDELDEKNLLHEVNLDILDDFLYKNSDISFEMLVFDYLMQKHVVVGYKDKILCYSIGKFTKNTKNIIYVRFFFDILEILNC